MNKIKVFMYLCAVCFVWHAHNAHAAQGNFLDPQRYSFEDGGASMYYQQSADYWTITNEKSAGTGSYSLKYFGDGPISSTQKAKNGGIDLPAGDYVFKVKVWKVAGSEIKGFAFNVKTPWKSIPIDIDSIETDKWVEISIPVQFNQDVVNSGCIIPISSAQIGNGTLYVDDIGFWGEQGEVKVELGATSSIHTTSGAQLNLPAGKYEVRLNIWKSAGTTVSSILSSISSPCVNLSWEIGTLAPESWVELSKSVLISDTVEHATFTLWLNNKPEKGGGIGEVYVDDITFVKLNNYTPVSGLSITENEISLLVNQEHGLDYSLIPQQASNKSVKCLSANSDIATINAEGVVKGIKEGSTQVSIYSQEGYFVARCAVQVKGPTSVSEQGVDRVHLSPNPFAKYIEIQQMEQRYQSIHIYDLSGNLVLKTPMKGEKRVVLRPEYSLMPKGVYVIKLVGTQGHKTMKLIRK